MSREPWHNAAVGDVEPGIQSVQILGSIHAIAHDGSLVELPSSSQRRLLAVLALHSPRSLRAEWLADVVDVSPGALRTLVARLRGVVGSRTIETTSTGYRLSAEVDAHRCCRAIAEATGAADPVAALDQALAGWAGPPLDEFSDEPWASGEVARLTETHATACDDLGASLIDRGRSAAAMAGLERQVAAYPYRDRSRRLLMRALAGSGRQAEALRAYQAYRTFLDEEVGTEPSPKLVEIERRIASGWNGVEPVERVDAPQTAGGDGAFVVPLSGALGREVAFVGRAHELAILEAERRRSAEGGLRSVIVSGEPGIGKTSLLALFAHRLDEEGLAAVVYGRCDTSSVPLQPFRSIVGTCVECAPLNVLHAHVAACGSELLRIAPQLGHRVEAPAPTETDHATDRFLLFEAVADLVRRLAARRPLVMLLDDLHWAEPTALQLLRHLANALAGVPLMVVLSCREIGEADPEGLRLALADLEKAGALRLGLVGLDETELAELVRDKKAPSLLEGRPDAAADELVARLAQQTAGHPLYATQLLRYWDETGDAPSAPGEGVPRQLRDVVWSRVNALGPDATNVLMAAAVLGLEFDESVLVKMVDVDEPVVVSALDAATHGGLLVGLDDRARAARFVHSLVANALYSDLGGPRRARLHRRAAEALTGRRDVAGSSGLVALARHCAHGGMPDEAQRWFTAAGDAAFDGLSAGEAARHYQAALVLVESGGRPDAERADLLVRLGEADAARVLLPLMEPFAAEVSFTGVTSQGPIAAYIGKLASLLGDHDLGEQRLLDAYRIAEQFGWTYHRATTRFAMAEAQYRRLGSLDAEGRAWLDEATELCTTGGYASWLRQVETLETALGDDRTSGPAPTP